MYFIIFEHKSQNVSVGATQLISLGAAGVRYACGGWSGAFIRGASSKALISCYYDLVPCVPGS